MEDVKKRSSDDNVSIEIEHARCVTIGPSIADNVHLTGNDVAKRFGTSRWSERTPCGRYLKSYVSRTTESRRGRPVAAQMPAISLAMKKIDGPFQQPELRQHALGNHASNRKGHARHSSVMSGYPLPAASR